MAGFNTGALAMRHLAQLAAPASHPDPTAGAGAAGAGSGAAAGAAAAVRPLDDQLAAACRLGSAAAVRSALAEGADPSFVAPGGRSPVFEAAYHGHLEVLALLCDRDADVGLGWTMAMTGMTYTAREIALLCGHFQVVQVLDAVAGRGLATARQRLAWAQIVHGRLGPGEVAPVPGGRRALLSRDLLRLIGASRLSLCSICPFLTGCRSARRPGAWRLRQCACGWSTQASQSQPAASSSVPQAERQPRPEPRCSKQPAL